MSWSIHKAKTEAGALALVQRVYPSAQLGKSVAQWTRVVNEYGRTVADLERVDGAAPFIEVTIY